MIVARLRLVLSLVLGFLLAGSAGAVAQTAQGACPPPQTIYTFNDSSSVQALPGAEPPFCRFANLNGGQQVDLFLGVFSAASPIVQGNVDVLTSLLPLQVGKTVNLARVGTGDKSWQATVSVESYGSLDVPVGRLNCYVLLWTEPSGQGRWERRWWYCPALAYAAKYTAKFDVMGADGRSRSTYPASWELMGVRVP